MHHLREKKVIVFCVGASPYDEGAIKAAYEHNFKEELAGIEIFYCRGAWNEDAMSFADRTLCKMLQKAVVKKALDTYEPWEMALMSAVGQTVDWTDRKYLEPLLERINA